MTHRPLIGATLALGTGILAAFLWPPSVWLFLVTLLPVTLIFLLTKRPIWGQCALLLSFSLIGLLRFQQVSVIPANDISRNAPQYISLTGVVDSDVGIVDDKKTETPYSAHFELKTLRFEIEEM